jgi:CheY-like chemotaxis protein
MAEEKGLIILKNIDNAVIANIDPSGLSNAINHLLNNAIKFTLTGFIEISTTYLKSDNKIYPSVTIKDSGIGITKDKQKIIFQDFRQASEGKDRSYQGTGLGLSIVQKIMELMQGKIKLESEPGIGSTFTLTFPQLETSEKLKKQNMSDDDASVAELNEVTPDEFDILIVEDDMINAELTSFYLEGIATVDVAHNAETAIKMTGQKAYSVILMDINLGIGMDGFQATKIIRQNDRYKDIPIIATTGYTLYNEIELIKNSGFSEYLPKPFSREDLLASLKRNFLIHQL